MTQSHGGLSPGTTDYFVAMAMTWRQEDSLVLPTRLHCKRSIRIRMYSTNPRRFPYLREAILLVVVKENTLVCIKQNHWTQVGWTRMSFSGTLDHQMWHQRALGSIPHYVKCKESQDARLFHSGVKRSEAAPTQPQGKASGFLVDKTMFQVIEKNAFLIQWRTLYQTNFRCCWEPCLVWSRLHGCSSLLSDELWVDNIRPSTYAGAFPPYSRIVFIPIQCARPVALRPDNMNIYLAFRWRRFRSTVE